MSSFADTIKYLLNLVMPGKDITPESGHATATIDGQTIASTTSWLRCEGNVYFPRDTLVRKEDGVEFDNTELLTYCPWKGHAGYYTIKLGGESALPTA
jgi:uncharacterized protein (DUF427 family)